MVKTEIYTLKIRNFTRIPCMPQGRVVRWNYSPSGSDLAPSSSLDWEAAELNRITRMGRQIQCTDTGLYLVGHYSLANSKLRPEVWKFNFVTNRWSKISKKRNEYCKRLAYCSSVLCGNMLLVYCSLSSSCERQSLYFGCLPKVDAGAMDFVEMKQHRIMEHDSRDSRTICGKTSPHVYDGYSMAVTKENLYMVGGLSRESGVRYSMDVDMFCFRTREWTKLYDSRENRDGPAPRYGHSMTYYEDRLYIFGGGTLEDNFSMEDVPVFDLITNTWSTFRSIGDFRSCADYGHPFPHNRKLHACTTHPHQPSVIFINGGCIQPRNDIPAFGDTWQIDLKTMRWSFIQSMNVYPGKFLHSISCTPEGRMYLFDGSPSRDDTFSYGSLHSAWITVPKLEHACWDAFLHYVRKGLISLPTNLDTLQLPEEYRARLIVDDQLNNDELRPMDCITETD